MEVGFYVKLSEKLKGGCSDRKNAGSESKIGF